MTVTATSYYKLPYYQQNQNSGTVASSNGNTKGASFYETYAALNASSQQPQMEAPAGAAPVANTKDGKDDGKIGFFDAIGNIFKGVVNTVVNTVKDIVTHPGKLLLTVGAIALSIACPPAGVALAVVGGVMGGAQMVGGVVKACTAKTDAEAEAAFQDIGGGGLQVGLSILGAKAGIKAMKNVSGSAMEGLATKAASGEKVGILDSVKAYGKDFKSSLVGGDGYKGVSLFRNIKEVGFKDGISKTYEDFKTNPVTGEVETLPEALKTKYSNFKEGLKNLKNKGADRSVKKAELTESEARTQLKEFAEKLDDNNNIKTEIMNKLDDENFNFANKEQVKGLIEQIKKSELKPGEKSELIKSIESAQKAQGKVENMNLKHQEKIDAASKSLDDARQALEDVKAKENVTPEEIKAAETKVIEAEKALETAKNSPKGSTVEGIKEEIADASKNRAEIQKKGLIRDNKELLETLNKKVGQNIDDLSSKELIEDETLQLSKSEIKLIKSFSSIDDIVNGNKTITNPFKTTARMYAPELLETAAVTASDPYTGQPVSTPITTAPSGSEVAYTPLTLPELQGFENGILI